MIKNLKALHWLKLLHLLLVAIWFGVTVTVAVLGIYAFKLREVDQFVFLASLIPVICQTLILPVGLLTIAEGLVYGFFTKWGFFKQRWLCLKWILLLATGVCVGIGGIRQIITLLETVAITGLMPTFSQGSLFFLFVILQLIFLILMFWLSVFKPFGKKHLKLVK